MCSETLLLTCNKNASATESKTEGSSEISQTDGSSVTKTLSNPLGYEMLDWPPLGLLTFPSAQ